MLQHGRSLDWLSSHYDYLYCFAVSRLKNREAAQDLVQETLLSAWKGRDGFKENSSIRTWLTGILKNKIADHIRGEIRHRNMLNDPRHNRSETDADGFSNTSDAWRYCPEQLCNHQKILESIEVILNKLPEQQQTVFRMRELIGEDTGSICERLGITTTHVNVLIHRARKSLQKCLENDLRL